MHALLRLDPADNFLRHALALEHIKAGDDVAAREVFASILRDDESYVGSYYHLAKLLERMGEKEAAITCYEKGLAMARKAGDNHSYNELQNAFEDLVD